MSRLSFRPNPIGVILILFLFPILANAGIVVIDGLTHLHDVVPGETYRGKIEIQNTDDHEQAVKLYKRDYTFNLHDEAFYEEPGTNLRSNAGWIDISPSFLVLKPKEKTQISYEIKVPKDGTMIGTYWSVIMVEGEAPIDANDLRNGLTVKTQIRYAIQIATTFNSSGERNLTFVDVRVDKEETNQYITVYLENKGDFMLTPIVSVELYNEDGQPVGVFDTIKKKIYPNTSVRYLFGLEGVSTGNYKALLLADCGGEDVFGMNLDLAISDD